MAGIKNTALAMVLASTAACSVPSPAGPSDTPLPSGTPARIELSAIPGVASAGGTVQITARVQDAYATALAGVPLAFSTDSGSLTADDVTDATGVAHALLTASPGTVQITASAGPVHVEVAAVVQPKIVQPVPPVSTPPPVPTFPAPSPPEGTLVVQLAASQAVLQPDQSVQLTATCPVRVVHVAWRFGDGTGQSEGLSASHSYAVPGDYWPNVAVTDERGRTAANTVHLIVKAQTF